MMYMCICAFKQSFYVSPYETQTQPSFLFPPCRREKYAWFVTLLAGTTALYASRTTVPLVAPSASASLRWSKTETGTVLSSFFWGYALTQVLGGYLGDRFGAERVLLAAGVGWGLITFWFHRIVYLFEDRDSSLNVIVLSRVLWGAFQGGYTTLPFNKKYV